METKEQKDKRYQDMFEYVDKIKVRLYGRHGEKLLKQYLALNRTPEQLAADLAELAELREKIKDGRLVVLPCKPDGKMYESDGIIDHIIFTFKHAESAEAAKEGEVL
jgi:hypothetical protein